MSSVAVILAPSAVIDYSFKRDQMMIWFCFYVFVLIQVINGLMEREDWQEAIQIPLGILPGGSGNALAASIHHYSQWVFPLMSHLNAWTNSAKKHLPHPFWVIIPKADWAHHSSGGRRTVEQTALLCSRRSFEAADNSQRSDVMGLKLTHYELLQ